MFSSARIHHLDRTTYQLVLLATQHYRSFRRVQFLGVFSWEIQHDEVSAKHRYRPCILGNALYPLTQPFACLPSHLPVDLISTFFSSSVVPGHRRASARTSLINSAHPGPARLARALEFTVEICAVEIFRFYAKPILSCEATPIQVKSATPI